jgi:hypothetical protein
VCGRNPLSFKFKRNNTKCLSILELTKLRKDREIQVSNGEILSFEIGMDEISLGGSKALYDHRIWIRDADVNPSNPSYFMGPVN